MFLRILKNWNGKGEIVFGIASKPINLRDKEGDNKQYDKEEYYDIEMSEVEYKQMGIQCYDSWNPHSKNSHLRNEVEEASELGLLMKKISDLESRLLKLESKNKK